MEWECRLNKTRPITLLETIRKLIVRIINNRLMNILIKNNILKGRNYAGLLGGSTFELIYIINLVLENSRENQKKL